MDASSSQEVKKTSPSARYEGLDAFRVIASFYVVFGHVYLSCGTIPELIPLFRAITFGFPFIVMSSFFVLTRALLAKPEVKFTHFFINSARRLWIPCFVWTVLYSLWWCFIYPALRGRTSFDFPPLTRIFGGYMHLWFLEFLFFGSLLLFLLLWWSKSRKISRGQFVALSISITAVSEFFFVYFFRPDKLRLSMADVLPEAYESLNILLKGTVFHFFFVLPAVCLALYADEINNLFQKRLFRILSLAVVFITAVVYLSTNELPYLREAYTLAVFIAALQPWKISNNTVRLLATYSYAIYILHLLPVEILPMMIKYTKVEINSAFVVITSIIIYLASLAIAILLRKLFPWDWFLPLIPVGYVKKLKKQLELRDAKMS